MLNKYILNWPLVFVNIDKNISCTLLRIQLTNWETESAYGKEYNSSLFLQEAS